MWRVNPRVYCSSCLTAGLQYVCVCVCVLGLRSKMSMLKFSAIGVVEGWVGGMVWPRSGMWGGAITSHSCESPVATLLPGRVDHTLPCISLTGRPDALPATLHGCLALHLYPLLYTDPQRCYDLLFVYIWRYTGAFRPDSCKVFHGGKFCVTLSRLKLLDFVVTD